MSERESEDANNPKEEGEDPWKGWRWVLRRRLRQPPSEPSDPKPEVGEIVEKIAIHGNNLILVQVSDYSPPEKAARTKEIYTSLRKDLLSLRRRGFIVTEKELGVLQSEYALQNPQEDVSQAAISQVTINNIGKVLAVDRYRGKPPTLLPEEIVEGVIAFCILINFKYSRLPGQD